MRIRTEYKKEKKSWLTLKKKLNIEGSKKIDSRIKFVGLDEN